MAGGSTEQATDAAARFTAAHRALVADGRVQFDLRAVTPRPPPPAWFRAFGHWLGRMLRPVGRLFRWLAGLLPDAPYARILLWSVLALLALALAVMIYLRVREGVWRLPRNVRRRAVQVEAGEEAWHPSEGPARAWLEEADRLASEGRYGEAVHHLLLRSVEDIGGRRPQLVRPALTSRDLAAADAIPEAPRTLFAGLARVVERSLFGGGSVAAEEWAAVRARYADFIRPQAWRAPA